MYFLKTYEKFIKSIPLFKNTKILKLKLNLQNEILTNEKKKCIS